MHITKIELEDIKSHAGSTFDFSRGTTAITGENGAGKTTLIEAVAWALFDVLDYKKDDFVRRGAKKGTVRVTFEAVDEREYTVYRDTGTGYYVFDPRLKQRVADKKDEVCRKLCELLGVEAGTDLESLFKHAVGVPQGTFTAIFLATAADRKKTFDKLLKVEEYRRGADELLKTSRFLEQKISDVNVTIARAEGELARYETVESELKEFAAQAETLGKDLDELNEAERVKAASVTSFEAREAKLNSLTADRDTLKSEAAKAELVYFHRQSEVERAREAAEKVNLAKPDADRHVAALDRLKELERERGVREELRLELAKTEAAIATVRADQKRFQDDLANVHTAHQSIESLKPNVAAQERLEGEVERLRNDFARANAVAGQIKSLDEKIGRLRESYRANQSQLADLRERSNGAGAFDSLQKRDAEIMLELARLQASLDRDESFQAEIKNGLCPILSQKCLNLKEGETLESFVTSQFSELRDRITVLQDEHGRVSVSLRTSREAEKFAAQIVTLEMREAEIGEEGKRLKLERESLEKEIENLPRIESELAAAEAELKALDNPKARIKLLENDLRREPEIRECIAKSEKNLERLESDRRITVEKLESYKDLDAQLAEASDIRDKTADAHRMLLANESLANSLAKCESELAGAKTESDRVLQALAVAEKALGLAAGEYDRALHLTEKAELLELQKRKAELSAIFGAAKRRESELDAELKRLAETRTAMQAEFREKERLGKVAEATEFIRTTLKEAAPLVARNYVYHVSVEANQTFREITGNAEHSLRWGEDYGIILEEGGYDRPFANLSGGEQMAAALSVRLALLKQLSEIRIAFFDEPTTNMDVERRENLAMQISRIGHFDQLFVISHDDTFEGYVDNVVAIEKDEHSNLQPSL